MTQKNVFFLLAVAALGVGTAAQSRPASVDAHPQTGVPFKDCPNCPMMVHLPLGQFMMGSPSAEHHRFDNEGPQHVVKVVKPIAIGMYPITAAQFAQWTGVAVQPADARLPAVGVTWFEANDYAKWLSHLTGHTYRLPTEAEYEFAERAGTTSPYYWGSTIGVSKANCTGCGSSLDGTGSTPVGSFPPNGFGLYDMAGDVFEWVEDCYLDTFDGAPSEAQVARQAPSGDCAMRTLRASSWFNLPSFLRSAYRFREVPGGKSARRGFRLVREDDKEA